MPPKNSDTGDINTEVKDFKKYMVDNNIKELKLSHLSLACSEGKLELVKFLVEEKTLNQIYSV